ncbi:MAG: hypothetical protein Q7R66_18780 [Undibacterium sp.]|uniref:hypothetical protein n=1 Tax=Undibacterium sp. TaxID=1914977 RepID=UPI002721C373|nr:hypothetical protein [Undibacterium sp.]MDO8654221.1 hypothetical protein [Undibacterium sp.]
MAKKSTREMTGTKSPRQRVWEAIRSLRRFTCQDLEHLAKQEPDCVKDYVKALAKAGFITVFATEKVNALCARNIYGLARDNGIEAPRFNVKGVLMLEGTANERMWGTMRRLFTGQDFNYSQLAAFASTPTSQVSEATAKRYMWFLHSAKYLECTVRQKRGQPARFRLLATMDTGSRPPAIQRATSVIDQNTNRVMWEEKKGEEDDLV